MSAFFVKIYEGGEVSEIRAFSNIDELFHFLGTLDKDRLSVSIYKAECLLDWS